MSRRDGLRHPYGRTQVHIISSRLFLNLDHSRTLLNLRLATIYFLLLLEQSHRLCATASLSFNTTPFPLRPLRSEHRIPFLDSANLCALHLLPDSLWHRKLLLESDEVPIRMGWHQIGEAGAERRPHLRRLALCPGSLLDSRHYTLASLHSGKVSSSISCLGRAATRSKFSSLGMSAAGAATAAVVSSSAKAARKAPDSTKPAPKAAGGLKIQGAAKNKAQGGGEAEGSKAGGGGPGKSEGGGPTRKKSRKGSNPSNPTLISESKAKGTGGGGGQAARPDAPLWRSKQALKNKAGLDLPPASTTSSRPPQPTVEPLKVTNRARLPTFNRKAPSSMYHSPFLPHSFSTASDPRSTALEYTEGQSALHRAVQASWVLSQPSSETIAARKAAMDKVAQATAAFEGTFELALFGSVANGVDNDLSDLDVCVVVRLPFTLFPTSADC